MQGASQFADPYCMLVGGVWGLGEGIVGYVSEPGFATAREESEIRLNSALDTMGDKEFLMVDENQRDRMIGDLENTIDLYNQRNNAMQSILNQIGDNDNIAIDQNGRINIYYRDDLNQRINDYNDGIYFANKIIEMNRNYR